MTQHVRRVVAGALLEIGAVGFDPLQPVRFKSGILSPIYIDNRRLPFWPAHWRAVIEGFHALIQDNDLAFDVIAGIETAGIPHSAALAYSMSMPSVFIRKQAKDHGLKNRIEGGDVEGARALLIEDLVSTGGSSLSGVEALRDAGAIADSCLAIVSYGFVEANEAFAAAQVVLRTLTDFQAIAEVGVENGLFGHDEMDTILDWLSDPHGWADRAGFGP